MALQLFLALLVALIPATGSSGQTEFLPLQCAVVGPTSKVAKVRTVVQELLEDVSSVRVGKVMLVPFRRSAAMALRSRTASN